MTRTTNAPERLKEAPAHALRAVFAGIGQALLVSDRVRRKLTSAPDAADVAAEKAGRDTAKAPVTRPTAVKSAAEPDRPMAQSGAARSATKSAQAAQADVTSRPNATARTKGKAAGAGEAAGPGRAAGPGEAVGAAAATPAAQAGVAGGEPPIPNYDALSIASLRARLRGLDLAQVGALLRYEKARGSRSDVVAMYERRIAKLTEADG